MKKKYLLLGSLALFQFFAKAQDSTGYVPKKIQKTDIEFVYTLHGININIFKSLKVECHE